MTVAGAVNPPQQPPPPPSFRLSFSVTDRATSSSTTDQHRPNQHLQHPVHCNGVSACIYDSQQHVLYTAGRDASILSWTSTTSTTASPLCPSPPLAPPYEGCGLADLRKWNLRLLLPDKKPSSNEVGAASGVANFRSSYSWHTDWVNAMVLCQKHHCLISASSDRTVLLWKNVGNNSNSDNQLISSSSLPQQQQQVPIKIGSHADYVKCLAMPSALSNRVISGGLDNKICAWDYSLGGNSNAGNIDNAAAVIFTSNLGVYSLASSHSGNTIIHGGPGGLLQLHDSRIKATKTGKSQLSLMGHKDTVRSIIMHPSDTTFITASSDCTVKIWDTRLAACTTTLRFESPVWALTAATSAGDSNNNTCLDKFWVGCRDGSVIKVGRGSAGFPPNLSVASSARGASFDNKNSSRHHQQQRQLWKTGSTGEDLDRMRPGGGSSRPQSVSAPLPLTDVGGRFGEVEGVDCVLVCKELESVHSISGVDGESIWVATASSTVNCWNDIPFKSSQVINFARSKPIDLSNRPLLVPSGALIDQFSTYLPESNNELSEATSELLDKKEGNVDSPSNINGDDDNDDPSVAGIPVFVEPIGSLRGGPRIVKFESLNDRRRVVVLDSYGNVSVWDIIRCKRIKLIFGYRWDNTRIRSEDICVNYESDEVKGAAEVYGNDEMTSNELFKKVVEDANTVDWVANWCVLDAKCGYLMAHMEESKCFDAEAYYEECGLSKKLFNEDLRINLGKWMLSNLLINYTSGIYSARRKKKLALAQGPPRAVREASSRSFDGSAATAAAAVNTTTTAYSASSNSAPASTTASFNIPPNNIPPAVTISLTAGNSSSGGGALPSLKVTSPTPIILAPLTPTHDDNQVNEAQPPSSSNDSSLIPASVISNLPGITSTPPPQTEHPLNNLASNSNYFASSTTHNGLLERIKGFSRRKSQETPDRKLKSGGKKSEENDEEESGSNNNTMAIPPALARSTSSLGNGLQGEESVLNPHGIPHFNEEETPFIPLPLNTQLLLSHEESPEICGYLDDYRGTVGMSEWNKIDHLQKVLPNWISDLIVEGKMTPREPAKISFFLLPLDGLPELPNGSNRLSANRMLRIRKLLVYLLEKSVVEDPSPNSEENPQAKAERLLELSCQEKTLSIYTTLAMLKYHIWKGSGDVTLYYGRRKKQL